MGLTHSKAADIYYDSGLVVLIICGLPANVLTGIVASKCLRQGQMPLNIISKTFHVLVIWNVVTNGLATAWCSVLIAARQGLINLRHTMTCDAFGFVSSWLAMVTVWLPLVTSLSRYNVAKATIHTEIEPWSVRKINIISVLTTVAMSCVCAIPFTPIISYHLTRLHGCTAQTNSIDFQFGIITNLLRGTPILFTAFVYTAIFFQYRKLRCQLQPEHEQQQAEALAVLKIVKGERKLTLLMFATVMHLGLTALLGAILLNFKYVSGLAETGCLLKNSYHAIAPVIIGLSSGRYRREIRKLLEKFLAYF